MSTDAELDTERLQAQAAQSAHAAAEAHRLAAFHASMLTDQTPWTVFALGGGQNLWAGPVLSVLRRLAAQLNDGLNADGFRVSITLEEFETHPDGSETVNITDKIRGLS